MTVGNDFTGTAPSSPINAASPHSPNPHLIPLNSLSKWTPFATLTHTSRDCVSPYCNRVNTANPSGGFVLSRFSLRGPRCPTSCLCGQVPAWFGRGKSVSLWADQQVEHRDACSATAPGRRHSGLKRRAGLEPGSELRHSVLLSTQNSLQKIILISQEPVLSGLRAFTHIQIQMDLVSTLFVSLCSSFAIALICEELECSCCDLILSERMRSGRDEWNETRCLGLTQMLHFATVCVTIKVGQTSWLR